MGAIVLDTETTGLDRKTARVIELALVGFEEPEKIWTRRFNPGIPLPEEITKITGITDAMLAGMPLFAEHAKAIIRVIEEADAILGYNIFFDQEILDAELERLGLAVRWPTLVCAKRIWSIHDPRNLQNAFKTFVDPAGFEGAHGALADALAAGQVIREQQRIYQIQGVPWKDIDPKAAGQWGFSNHIRWENDRLTITFGKHIGKVTEVPMSYWTWILRESFPVHVKDLAGAAIQIMENRVKRSRARVELMTTLQDELEEWARTYAKENFR